MRIEKPKRIRERFLIFPFYCNRCGDRFMLKHGAVRNNPDYGFGDWILNDHKYYKYCYDCAAIEFQKEYVNRGE